MCLDEWKIKVDNVLFLPGNVAVVKGIQGVQSAGAVASAQGKMLTTQSLLFWDPVEQVILLEWWG